MAADHIGTRLYVGNLLYQVQPREVECLFKAHGSEIKNIDMSIDPFTNRNPSYCFVDFHTPEDASQAMGTLQGILIRDRPVKINIKTEKRDRQTRLPTKTYDHGWRAKQLPTRTDVTDKAYVFDRWTRKDDRQAFDTATAQGRRLWVGGISRIPNQDVVNADMRELFEGCEIVAVSKLVSPRQQWQQANAGSQYYCFVDFVGAHEAREARKKCDGRVTPQGGKYKIEFAR